MTLREWLAVHMDNLMATVFFAVVISALVGFFKRSTGMAIFVSCTSATVLALLGYLIGSAWGYDWKILIPTLGVGAGFCAVGLFKIAIKFAERVEKQDAAIGKKLADRAIGKVVDIGGDQ